jgi:hypothetical protein
LPRSITIPDVDDTTVAGLVEEAGRRGLNVEMVAGLLLRHGLEWERRRAEQPAYHNLDALAGTWSEDEAVAFLQAVADFEQVDPSLWQ